MDNKHKKTERVVSDRKWLGFVFAAVVTLLFVVGAYGFRMYADARTSVNNSYAQLKGKSSASKKVKATKPLSLLLIGTDTGSLGRTNKLGNADTIMVVTINPKTDTTTMVSIPRDTYAQIQGGSYKYAKINSSFLVGGSDCTVKTVEKLIDVPIDYYVTVNMGGLSQIVDAVGGVDVDVPFSWSDPGHDGGTFTKGPAHLNGKQALQFARMRYKDPQGDYGRQQRQQQVISAIVKSLLSTKNLTNYKSVLNSLNGNLLMNLKFNDLVDIANGYNSAIKTFKKTQMKEIGAFVGEASFQIPSTEQLQSVSDELRGQLELPKKTLDNGNVTENKLNEQNGFDFSSEINQKYHTY
ncbi:LCP family protein [Lacticaseibacillus hulanensis]|uniref:LCP family protein n=1 Tax=Lacticaseibacillus hulanensis TaxID=2493111 RepID=UPI000FD9190C|nr:LCP family protein [Lacticaseibacillus hulanensis]